MLWSQLFFLYWHALGGMARQPLATLSPGSLQLSGLRTHGISARRNLRRRGGKKSLENKLTLTHLRSSCRHWINGNLRCTSTHKSLGCSRRSGHTGGPGSASTRLHLQEWKKKNRPMALHFFKIIFQIHIKKSVIACSHAQLLWWERDEIENLHGQDVWPKEQEGNWWWKGNRGTSKTEIFVCKRWLTWKNNLSVIAPSVSSVWGNEAIIKHFSTLTVQGWDGKGSRKWEKVRVSQIKLML